LGKKYYNYLLLEPWRVKKKFFYDFCGYEKLKKWYGKKKFPPSSFGAVVGSGARDGKK
jgi:hypothetical protein